MLNKLVIHVINLSMTVFAILMIFTSTLAKAEPYIIDGRDAGFGEYPAVLSIEMFDRDQMSLCTATFISNNTLITAAHCVDQKNINDIVLPTEYRIKKIIIHDAYSRFKDLERAGVAGSEYLKIAYDIALIILDGAKSSVVMDYSTHPKEGEAVVVGYGGKNILTRTQMNLHEDQTTGFKRVGKTNVETIHPLGRIDSAKRVFKVKHWYQLFDQYAASLKEKISTTTRGDSGGPLIQNQKIVGIISSSDASHQDDQIVYSATNYFAGLHSSIFQDIRTTAIKFGSSIR